MSQIEEANREFDERFDEGKALDGDVYFVDMDKFSTRRKEIKSFWNAKMEEALSSYRKSLIEKLKGMKSNIKPDNSVADVVLAAHNQAIEEAINLIILCFDDLKNPADLKASLKKKYLN